MKMAKILLKEVGLLRYSDPRECYELIYRDTWPKGVRCPAAACRSKRIDTEPLKKKGLRRYVCNACDLEFNDLSGSGITISKDWSLQDAAIRILIRRGKIKDQDAITRYYSRRAALSLNTWANGLVERDTGGRWKPRTPLDLCDVYGLMAQHPKAPKSSWADEVWIALTDRLKQATTPLNAAPTRTELRAKVRRKRPPGLAMHIPKAIRVGNKEIPAPVFDVDLRSPKDVQISGVLEAVRPFCERRAELLKWLGRPSLPKQASRIKVSRKKGARCLVCIPLSLTLEDIEKQLNAHLPYKQAVRRRRLDRLPFYVALADQRRQLIVGDKVPVREIIPRLRLWLSKNSHLIRRDRRLYDLLVRWRQTHKENRNPKRTDIGESSLDRHIAQSTREFLEAVDRIAADNRSH